MTGLLAAGACQLSGSAKITCQRQVCAEQGPGGVLPRCRLELAAGSPNRQIARQPRGFPFRRVAIHIAAAMSNLNEPFYIRY